MGRVHGAVQVKVTMHKYYSVPLVLDSGDAYAQLKQMLENEEIPLTDEFEIEEEVEPPLVHWVVVRREEEDLEDADSDDDDDRIFGPAGDIDGLQIWVQV